MKRCLRCKKEKDLSEFNKLNKSKDGHQPRCRECEKEIWHNRVSKSVERRKQYSEARRKADDRNIGRYLLNIAKKRAKEEGIPCTITVADIVVPTNCPITGAELRRYQGKFDQNSYTLDKVVPELGYVPGNVRVISWRANNAKYNLSREEIVNLLRYLDGEI